MDDWPQEQRAMHEAFSTWVTETSQARVWVVCGAKNRGRLEKQALIKLVVTTGDIRLQLFLEQDVDGTIRRIFVCVPHPESLFYLSTQPVGMWSDHGWNSAGALVGITLDQTYFQRYLSHEGYPDKRLDVLATLKRDRALEMDGNPPIEFKALDPAVLGYLRKQDIVGKEAIEEMQRQSSYETIIITVLKRITDKGMETKWFQQPWPELCRRAPKATLLHAV